MRQLFAIIGLTLTFGSTPLTALASPSPTTGLWATEVTNGGSEFDTLKSALGNGCGGGISTKAMAATALQLAQANGQFPTLSAQEANSFVIAAADEFRQKNSLSNQCISLATFTARAKNNQFIPLTRSDLDAVLVQVRERLQPKSAPAVSETKMPAIATGNMEMSPVENDTKQMAEVPNDYVSKAEMEAAIAKFSAEADEKYLSKAEATANYMTQAAAKSMFLTPIQADENYASKTALATVESDVTKLTGNLGNLTGSVKTLTGSVGTLAGSVETLDGRVGTLAGKVSQVETAQADSPTWSNLITGGILITGFMLFCIVLVVWGIFRSSKPKARHVHEVPEVELQEAA